MNLRALQNGEQFSDLLVGLVSCLVIVASCLCAALVVHPPGQ